MNIRTLGIITRHGAPQVLELGQALVRWFGERGIAAQLDRIVPGMDMLVILGGDGTLLRVAAEAGNLEIPVVGINLGNLGFLTEIAASEMHQALEAILSGSIRIEKRMMLEACYCDGDGAPQSENITALNEVVIVKSSTEPVLRLRCWADREYITTYKADGLLLSTPTGSTAYNLSAGGPIVHAELRALLVTPICPFMLESRPLLLSPRTSITSQLADSARDVKILADGREVWTMGKGGRLKVRAAAKPLYLISSPHKGYFTILRNKLNWGGRDEGYPLPETDRGWLESGAEHSAKP